MFRRQGFMLYTFLAIVGILFVTTTAIGVLARRSLVKELDVAIATTEGQPDAAQDLAFEEAERRVLAQNDRDTWIIRIVTIAAAGALSFAAAKWLVRPLADLEETVDALARGDHDRRASVNGPTEIARIAASFNHMADSLVEGEQLRRQLVADVSHELRNPIAAALAQAEAMVDGVLPLDKSRVESLVDDLQHLSSLVDDLRELAAAESGSLHFAMAPFDLSELVSQQIKRVAPRLIGHVTLRAIGIDSPVLIEGDSLRLAQVLRNLLLNSRRHTPSGSITIVVEQSPSHVTVRVEDTGEGIPPEILPHIFERFYRADSSRASETGGAGLGLAISRSIVRQHGGEMFAASEVGEGTSIGFTLPRRPRQQAG